MTADVKTLLVLLRNSLRYGAEGHFVWVRASSNRISVGDRAGCLGVNGYWSIRLDGNLYYEHRLAWLWHHGKFPDIDLDHIDGDKWNNRIENLREATMSENIANSRLSQANHSGRKGVSWNKRLGRWHAYIVVSGKRKHLGFFETLDEASAAYADAAREAFGEFARP
jgi:hypothetical protein